MCDEFILSARVCPVRQSFFIYHIRPAETVQLQVGRLTFFYLFFCVCIALLKNQQHPTYGLGKVRTTGGSDNTTRRTEENHRTGEMGGEWVRVRLGGAV